MKRPRDAIERRMVERFMSQPDQAQLHRQPGSYPAPSNEPASTRIPSLAAFTCRSQLKKLPVRLIALFTRERVACLGLFGRGLR